MNVIGFNKREGRIAEVVARDAETGEELRVEARSVINAAGVYVDAVRRLDEPGAPSLVSPSQGAHLVLDSSFFPGDTALLVPHTDDGRVLFAIPWHGRVLVGTTDTPVAEVAREPRPLRDEIAYLLGYLERYFTRPPGPGDVLSIFAGLRPLLRGKAGAANSQAVARTRGDHLRLGAGHDHRRKVDHLPPHGLGRGRLRDAGRQAWRHAPSATASLKLHGWREPERDGAISLAVYGSDAPRVGRTLQGTTRVEPATPSGAAVPGRRSDLGCPP